MSNLRAFFAWRWLLLLPVLLAGGCHQAGPDFYVTADDTKGLVKGSRVKWRGAEVGQVTEISMKEGKFKLDARLNDNYRGQIHADVRAQLANGIMTKMTPVLELYGGTDPNAPLLPRGAQIQVSDGLIEQARAWWPVLVGGVVCAIVLFLLAKMLRGFLRFGLFLAGLALLILTGMWFARGSRQGAGDFPAEWQARLSQLANTTFRSPEAVAAWQSLQQQVDGLLQKAKQDGLGVGAARDPIVKMLDSKIAALRASGQTEAANELAEFRRKLLEIP
jgi:hypothetical protein